VRETTFASESIETVRFTGLSGRSGREISISTVGPGRLLIVNVPPTLVKTVRQSRPDCGERQRTFAWPKGCPPEVVVRLIVPTAGKTMPGTTVGPGGDTTNGTVVTTAWDRQSVTSTA
jgi:hypothetical protein